MTDDASDLQAAREAGPGSNGAFARIFDRHAPVVRVLCRHHLGSGADPATLDDALQETFIRAYRLLDRLDRPDRLRAWLYGIARNVCSEFRRSDRRRRRYEGAAAVNHTFAPSAPAPLLPEQACARSEDLGRLSEAIDQLRDDERLAIHLYYLDPDPVTAAREALGLSRSAFYKLLARAREHLATALKEVRA